MSANKVLRTGWSLVLLVLLAVPAGAAGGVIKDGVDIWRTPGNGASFIDFSSDSIPAGFFCSGSEAFTGVVAWKGLQVRTSPPGAFGDADTIVHRLDNAYFGSDGVAVTRLQMAAVSLVSIAPIETSCGQFRVRATLAPGAQPTTEMRIVRTREDGGYFEAPLTFNARITFTPVGGKRSERLQIDRLIDFPPAVGAQWSEGPGNARRQLEKRSGYVVIDTDGDRRPDTRLPGTSNFFPVLDLAERALTQKATAIEERTACGAGCHDASGECHCPEIIAY